MTSTNKRDGGEVGLPFSPYMVSEWTGPEMTDKRTWVAYNEEQLRAYAAERVARVMSVGASLGNGLMVYGSVEAIGQVQRLLEGKGSP